MGKKIKVWFLDYGINVPEDFIIYKLLKKNFEVELNSNPDFLIYGSYSVDFLKYDCIRIHYSGEQESPDFDLHDYEIGFDLVSYGDRYIRLAGYQSLYLGTNSYFYNYNDLIVHGTSIIDDLKHRKFCSYLSSNPSQKSNRDKIVESIAKYKDVTSGGKHNNNIGYIVKDKIDFISNFKFNIAAENAIYNYYTTEKIYQAFLAKTIPIYIGNPLISKEFNPKAFIDFNEFSSTDDFLKFIQKVDQDDSLWLEMINQPKVLDSSIITTINDFERFLKNIFEQPISNARRRPNSQRSTNKAINLYTSSIIAKVYFKFPKAFRRLIKRIVLNDIV